MKKTESLTSLPFRFVEYRQHLITTASEEIIDKFASHPAGLTQITIWCESRAHSHATRKALIKAAQKKQVGGLLLPQICTMQEWLFQHFPPEQVLMNDADKQLLLMEAIRQFPALFNTANAWQVTKELVGLFNECTLAQVPLSAGEEKFNTLLSQAYASPFDDLNNISRESEIIYLLWQAYTQQINTNNWLDPIQHYCNCLRQSVELDKKHTLFTVGIHRFTQLEANFLTTIADEHSLTIYYPQITNRQYVFEHHPLHKYCAEFEISAKNKEPRTFALNTVYDNSAHTFERIAQIKNNHKENPYSSWLSLFTTNSIENHVNAVCLQTKQWLLEDKFPIGIVSSDRLLTRRIRAVLEDAGITADDLGGWALSTTSAATIIEILLDAIETNFRHEHLFDLLTNPFLADNYQDKSYLEQVNQLRHQVVNNRSVTHGGIGPYITFIESSDSDFPNSELANVLRNVQSACKTLLSFSYQNETELPQFANQLQQLLKQTNISSRLKDDEAGQILLSTLEASLQSIKHNKLKLNWKECRQWLQDLLEHSYFAPNQVDQRVILCGFDHTDFMQFSAVIVAGVEQSRLHSNAGSRTFFNEKVRKELGLQTASETEAIKFVRFRQLLEQNDNILLCAETECRGEAQEISPWVKLLELFSQQAFEQSLHNSMLDYLLSQQQQYDKSSTELAATACRRPSPATPEDLLPATVSATQYQALIDCPYQYFAKYILDITPEESADEMDAAEFGRLVHQCLLEFHFDQAGNAKYDDTELNADAHDTLVDKLTKISTEVFIRTAYPDAIKQGWLQRWLTNIPSYIDWTIFRSEEWQPQQGEVVFNTALTETVTLQGQIDRLDSNTKGLALIDYKTGALPSKKSVLQGETVQLPFYALLADKVVQAEYLELGKAESVAAKVSLHEQDLQELSRHHYQRLTQIINELSNNTLLPALGNGRVCKLCDYQGFCRKAHWKDMESDNNNNLSTQR